MVENFVQTYNISEKGTSYFQKKNSRFLEGHLDVFGINQHVNSDWLGYLDSP
jgi:hypothetical protein